MSNYLVTLTPLDKFFFGGDMTFNVHGDDEHNSRFASYIIESSMFPQQTSLLGMMRFLLLRNNADLFDGTGIRPGVTDQVSDLIGPSSFMVKEDGKKGSKFGKITRLHRCFVRCIKSDGTVHDLDAQGFDHNQGALSQKYGFVNGRKVRIPDLGGYNAKEGYVKYLSDGIVEIPLFEVFAEDKRIGIQRDITTGKTSDAGLFKQISYRFNNTSESRYCFAFYLEAEADFLKDYSGQTVSVGADNSQFVIGIEEVSGIPGDDALKAGRIVLKSPAYLSGEDVAKASFAFTETIPFRFLKTSVKDTESYSILPRYKGAAKMKAPARSEGYELYAAGSVFYFDDDAGRNDFIDTLRSYEGFRQIGYNEF